MTFPKSSPFEHNEDRMIEIERIRPATVSEDGVTKVKTSDIEELEHELRELSIDAGSPTDARLFDELANKVASFYKG